MKFWMAKDTFLQGPYKAYMTKTESSLYLSADNAPTKTASSSSIQLTQVKILGVIHDSSPSCITYT